MNLKIQLKLEELAMFLGAIALLRGIGSPWWIYIILVIGPDIGMIGYLANSRVGAFTYNLFHHKAVAILIAVIGVCVSMISVHAPEFRNMDEVIYSASIILFGHASMDRIFGYGLKYPDHFKHTHLGRIGGKEGN